MECRSSLLLETAADYRFSIWDLRSSKLVTHNLVMSMNDPAGRISFVSRCPANFERKLESRMIQKACCSGQWEEIGSFHDGKSASIYRGQSFVEEVCGQPMRLLVLESFALREKEAQSLEKAQKAIGPYQKDLEKKVFLCFADARKK